ncbi:MAG: T9SS type A sorting domain-containing protein, partial [Chitinophagaceae bacterium]|nr:T9SS type A sorting domain-containing protein [Chitinophagaceae bacterium]
DGNGGNDTVNGEGGNDRLFEEAGNDTLNGGIGNDTAAIPYCRTTNPTTVVCDAVGNIYFSDVTLGTTAWRVLNPVTGKVTTLPTGGQGVFDATGNWYFVSGPVVMKRSVSGALTTVAGNGSTTYSGDGGSALLAGMNPSDVGVDAAGNIYICDRNNRRIRKVTTAGVISTVAGTGLSGSTGDGGPALTATFTNPFSISVEPGGGIYVSDQSAGRIRYISTGGIITTIAGGGSSYSDGGPATASSLSSPGLVRVSSSGDIYVLVSSKVRKISGGIITTAAGNGSFGFSGDGGPASAAQLYSPRGIALNPAGELIIADYSNSRIRKVTTAGVINTIAGNGRSLTVDYGDGGDALEATFATISAVTSDTSGNIFIADANANVIRRVDATTGIITRFAGIGSAGYFGDGGPATSAALSGPSSISFDGAGNLYIGESGSDHVRKVSPSGIITTVAGGGIGGPGDGGPATAAVFSADGVAADAAGNIYIADNVAKRLRRVDAATGIITTVAGNDTATTPGDGGPATAAALAHAYGVSFDRVGNIYVGGNQVRKITPSGIISTIPIWGQTVAVDTMGNIYTNYGTRILRYDIYKYISVVAGNGVSGYSGDNGPASAALLVGSGGQISIDRLGRLYAPGIYGVRRVSSLSPIIDIPPVFARGASAIFNVCKSSTGNSLDTLLRVNDGDAGQPLTWTVISGPLHGTLGGFPYTTTSTGVVVNPSGLTYTPTAGYSGIDNFTVRISDGQDTARFDVLLNVVNESYSISLSNSPSVCVGDTVYAAASVSGGTWSAANANVTLVQNGPANAWAIGMTAGTSVITYTLTGLCGVYTATSAIGVLGVPATPVVTTTQNTLCEAAMVTFAATPAGGTWTTNDPVTLLVYGDGRVTGRKAGTALITYKLSSMCGSASATHSLTVLPKPLAGYFGGTAVGCVGGEISIAHASYIAGGAYTVSDPGVAARDTTGKLIGLKAGSTLYTYEVSNSCGTSSASVSVTVHPLPEMYPLVGKTVLLTGSVVNLRGSSPDGTWTSSDANIVTVNGWGDVMGHQPGIASVTYSRTSDKGCVAGITTQVSVVDVASPLFLMQPNPAKGTVTIKFRNTAATSADVFVTDITGRVWYMATFSMVNSDGTAIMDVTHIPDGVYTITVHTADGDQSDRIVILR